VKRRTHCECGFQLGYAMIGGETLLYCARCERVYPIEEPPKVDKPTPKFDTIDLTLLKHISSVESCTPAELCAVCAVGYSATLRRMYRIVRTGYVYAQNKHRHWYYYRTDLLKDLAKENTWLDG
jgi:hypothetical protein